MPSDPENVAGWPAAPYDSPAVYWQVGRAPVRGIYLSAVRSPLKKPGKKITLFFLLQGNDTQPLPRSMHKEHRGKVLDLMRAAGAVPGGLVLVHGGVAKERNDSDHEPIFRQVTTQHLCVLRADDALHLPRQKCRHSRLPCARRSPTSTTFSAWQSPTAMPRSPRTRGSRRRCAPACR